MLNPIRTLYLYNIARRKWDWDPLQGGVPYYLNGPAYMQTTEGGVTKRPISTVLPFCRGINEARARLRAFLVPRVPKSAVFLTLHAQYNERWGIRHSSLARPLSQIGRGNSIRGGRRRGRGDCIVGGRERSSDRVTVLYKYTKQKITTNRQKHVVEEP